MLGALDYIFTTESPSRIMELLELPYVFDTKAAKSDFQSHEEQDIIKQTSISRF